MSKSVQAKVCSDFYATNCDSKKSAMYNTVKYSRLTTDRENEDDTLDNTTDTFNFNSVFTYEQGRAKYGK
jgi:hypothetical protein